MESVPKCYKFADGSELPSVGLGTLTFGGKAGKAEEVEAAVKVAIDAGYRHIDCAWAYGTEDALGNAIDAKIQDGTVKREDLFITTKLWDRHHNPSLVKKALEDSLRRLKTSYVDLYLIHWPTAFKDDEEFTQTEIVPKDAEGNVLYAHHDNRDVWKVMEECQRAGLARRIGLSNFNRRQITSILDSCTIKPVVNQVEVSPYFNNARLVQFCRDNDILVMAYAPLGSPTRPWRQGEELSPLDEPVLKQLAAEKGKTVAQIILRFHLQNGIAVIPKSITPSRIKENIDLFDFELSSDDMQKVASLNKDLRSFKQEVRLGHPEYPFHDPY